MEMMDVVDSKLQYQWFDSIDAIKRAHWDSVVPRATGLKHKVLQTFEHSGINQLVCHYMLFQQNENPVAKANLYEVSMDFTSLDQNLSPGTRKIIKHWHPDFLTLSMIECGLFAMNGDGLVASDKRYLPEVITDISQRMHQTATEKNLDLLVFRDVPMEQFSVYEKALVPLGYKPVAGFTNAVIDISWPSIDDYLESLNSKDRYKLKRSLKISENFNIRVEVTSDYQHLAKELSRLWSNVNASSVDYNREQLDEAFFFESATRLNEDSEVILFYHGDDLVAFMWNLIGEEDYHMADWGVDYDFPQYREANFYRAASILSLSRAIDLGKKHMQLGMTNYVPKKLLGARMQPLVYFIKHASKPEFTSVVCRMMTDAIDQPEELDYYQSAPWDDDIISAEVYKKRINNHVYHYGERDAFAQVEQNYDIDILKLGELYSFYPESERIDLHLGRSTIVNMANNPEVIQAGVDSLTQGGAASEGSPFFSGCSSATRKLEKLIAEKLSRPRVQLFANGAAIHKAALSTILEPDSLVLMDEQNNPMLWEAVSESGCEIQTYAHKDVVQLEEALHENKNRKILIVTESVFSLFGDCADLKSICRLKKRYLARIYVDESLSFGLLGSEGEGLSMLQGVAKDVDIIAASTLPGFGIDCGFVAAPERVIEHMRHQASALLFAGGASDFTVSLLTAALDQLEKKTDDRAILFNQSEYLAKKLLNLDLTVIHHQFPIINVVVGDFMLALAIQKKLLNENIVVSVIGPPALPAEMTLVRISLHTDISWAQIEEIVANFEQIKADFRIGEMN